jgi:hypothetical protein
MFDDMSATISVVCMISTCFGLRQRVWLSNASADARLRHPTKEHVLNKVAVSNSGPISISRLRNRCLQTVQFILDPLTDLFEDLLQLPANSSEFWLTPSKGLRQTCILLSNLDPFMGHPDLL